MQNGAINAINFWFFFLNQETVFGLCILLKTSPRSSLLIIESENEQPTYSSLGHSVITCTHCVSSYRAIYLVVVVIDFIDIFPSE